MHYDVAVIGGGMSGLATAARLQAAGLSTIVLEAHTQPGGCAGYFRRRGFSFDVGATTLVDFGPAGIGGQLLTEIGLPDLAGDELQGYVAWLPDRCVTLHRDFERWQRERREKLGDSPQHRQLWNIFDSLANTFWQATRCGMKLPVQSAADLWRIVKAIHPLDWPLARYDRWTVGDLLRALGLRNDLPLVHLLAMLLEDTVHAKVDDAPLINGSLGITIRGAGLMRASGGMFGFWRQFTQRYRELGGSLRLGRIVQQVKRTAVGFRVLTNREEIDAAQVVSAVPVELTTRFAPTDVARCLEPYRLRNAGRLGSALVLFLGVSDDEVSDQAFTHHQLLQNYNERLGNGNNMFISVSSAGDLLSAPAGQRAVMISTHCELAEWEGLMAADYAEQKKEMTEKLLTLARRVFPELGSRAVVCELGTPRTFERFTRRPRGAVGGFRQCLGNTNQRAIPQRLPVPGFWLAGDTTWPGLGTVACVHGSRIVAEGILASSPGKRSANRAHNVVITASPRRSHVHVNGAGDE